MEKRRAGDVERMGDEKFAESRCPESRGEKEVRKYEDRDCDGRTVLREIWKEWEEYGEQQQKIEVGD